MDIRADNHILTLQLKDKQEIVLKYNEATITEAIDFLEIINEKSFSIIEFVYSFIAKHGDKTMTKKQFQDNVIMEFGVILDMIKKTRFAGFFETETEDEAEEKNIVKAEEIDQEKILKNLKREMGRIVSYFSGAYGMDPKSTMNTYTWREVIYWVNWSVYHENEKTPEGRKANKTFDTKEHIDDNREYYEDQFNKLDLYLKKLNQGKKN